MPRNPTADTTLRLAPIALRLGALLVIVIAATWASAALRESLGVHLGAASDLRVTSMLVAALLLYVLLLSLPFVPGAEIGIALLTALGASVAPLVWGATVMALTLSFLFGRLLPIRILTWILWHLRLRRAAALVTRAAQQDRATRIEHLLEGAPPAIVALALRRRYLALALLVNLPGNAVIGGGGGIMLLAGLSRLFAPLPTLAVICLAVAPVPLAVVLLGR